MTDRPLPAPDLDLVLSLTPGFWSRFAGARIFVTGGTGFIGQWLVQAVQRANDCLGARVELVVLTRDPAGARTRLPAFSRPDARLVAGDVARPLDAVGRFDLCVHAATDVGHSLRPLDPLKVFDSIVTGTRRVLDLAVAAGASRFLLTSSGAVYGPQPTDLEAMPETYAGAPDPMAPKAAYGNGKRAAEWLAAAYSTPGSHAGFTACSARIFALLGPGLPLDGGFAAGNFIRDVLAGRPIRIEGDGRPLRSYLYMADLCAWLLRMLEAGAPGTAYNVGSRHAISIADLAQAVIAAAGGDVPVAIAHPPGSDGPAPRYVPDNRKAQQDLGLAETIPLAEALARTIAWNR
jgi:nucleoside-diphosphate-sugar epimerase